MFHNSKSGSADNEAAALAPEALEEILAAHTAYVGHLHGGKRAVLAMRDLSGAQLGHRVLSGADLTGADLHGAVLKFADLVGATLYCANLQQIDGRCCNCSHADLRGASLNGSNLARATLAYADFRPGRLMRQIEGRGSELVDRRGSAANVDFGDCILHGATFECAYLQGANFRGAIIHATKFKNARLDDTDFTGAVLSNVNIEEMHLSENMLRTCVLAPQTKDAAAMRQRLAAMLEAHQAWIASDGRAGGAAVVDGLDLRPLGGQIAKFKLTALSARRVNAIAVNFSGMELQGVDFEEADLRGAIFDRADLRGVKFRGARLMHARFRGADMRPLHLRSGERRDLDVFRAEVTDEQLAEARTR